MNSPCPDNLPNDRRAVIFATTPDETDEYSDGQPPCLMPLADRPALMHALDLAERCQVREVHIVTGLLTGAIKKLANSRIDGNLSIKLHRVADEHHPYTCLTDLFEAEPNNTGSTLLLHADTIPADISWLNDDANPEVNQAKLRCFCYRVSDETTSEIKWSGAAVLTNTHLKQLRVSNASRTDMGQQCIELAEHCDAIEYTAEPLSVASGQLLLESQQRLLEREFPILMSHLKTAETGVWIGNNTRLHEDARLTAPVLIGNDCKISGPVSLGPNVVIGDGSTIDTDVVAENSLILPASAVGQSLDLSDVIVSGRHLYNARLGASIELCDDVLIGDLDVPSLGQRVAEVASRIAAVLLLSITWPMLLTTVLLSKFRGNDMRQQSQEFVRTPARENQLLWQSSTIRRWVDRYEAQSRVPGPLTMWQDLLFRVLPGLVCVAAGRLKFTGTTPRSQQELQQVPDHWRAVLLTMHGGLISESLVQHGPHVRDDRSSISDVWFGVYHERCKRLKLLKRYVMTLFRGPLTAATAFVPRNNSARNTMAVANKETSKSLVPNPLPSPVACQEPSLESC